MGYLYKLITIPKDEEFYPLNLLFYSVKNNIKALKNICFYIQNNTTDKEQLNDIQQITILIQKYYFEFFHSEIELHFLDEPIKTIELLNSHIKELIKVHKYYSNDFELYKPNTELKEKVINLQRVINEVINEFSSIYNREKQFDELDKLYIKKYGRGVPYGAYVFDLIIKDLDNHKTIEKKIKVLEQKIFFWNKEVLSNIEIMDDKEIKDRLLPLLNNELKLLLSKKENPPPEPEPETPFTDPKTHELFNYIVDNWNYNKGQKWVDIWNVINDLENYKPPYKNEYQNYIIQRFGYTGKFQYDKVKRDGNRDKQNLMELIETFSKK
jgi:hypothetical protein